MKHVIKVRALIVVCLIGVGVWSVDRMYRRLSRIQSVEIIYDQTLSQFSQAMITESLQHLKGMSTSQLARCCSAVCAAHPEIADIRAELNSFGTLLCEIDAHAIVCKINQDSLLLENNKVVSSCLYANELQEKLLVVSTDVSLLASRDCHVVRTILANLDEKTLSAYRMYYHDEHHVSLIHPTQFLSITCAPDSVPSFEKIEQCEMVAQNCKKTSCNQQIVADVRFEKQIVVYVNARGDKNGTHIA